MISATTEFYRLEVVLPPSAHALATVILNHYLTRTHALP